MDSGRNAKNGATPDVIPGQPQGQRISRTKKVIMETSALTQSKVTPRAAGELGNELEASRQNGNENASSNRKSVLQNCNSQIRPVTA